MKPSDILDALLEKVGLNKSEFSRQIKISPQALNSYYNDEIKTIKFKFANRIKKAIPNVNMSFLLYGTLPVLETEEKPHTVSDSKNEYLQKENDLLKQENEMLRQRLRLLEEKNIFETGAISDANNNISDSVSGHRKKISN